MKLFIFAYVLEFPKCFTLVFLLDCHFYEASRDRYYRPYSCSKETDIEVKSLREIYLK